MNAKQMSNSSRKLEATVISAEDLHPKRKNIYVVVRTDQTNSQSTDLDKDGGSFPAWNQKLTMDLPAAARSITVEVRSGRKVIGYADIPVSDFLGGYLPENYLSFLSYRLRDSHGDKNGIINLSVKVNGGGGGRNNDGCAASCSRPWMGVPVDDRNRVTGSGFVTGIPVVPYKY